MENGKRTLTILYISLSSPTSDNPRIMTVLVQEKIYFCVSEQINVHLIEICSLAFTIPFMKTCDVSLK